MESFFSFLALDVDFTLLVVMGFLGVATGDSVGCVLGVLELVGFARYLSMTQSAR